VLPIPAAKQVVAAGRSRRSRRRTWLLAADQNL
jgi:hypothetical protein